MHLFFKLIPTMLAFLFAMLLAQSAFAGAVVIVSAKSPVTTLNRAQVADIFLGKRTQFPNGMDAIPLDQPEDAPIRKMFYSSVTAQTPAQLKMHWSRLLFTGKGQPPREMPNTEAVKKAIAENANFIGYIDQSALDATVKVVFVSE